MKKILSAIILSFLIAAGYTAFNHFAFAQCVALYGGGQACPQGVNIAINKTVQNPQTNAFVDNLGVNDAKFSAEQAVTFQLVVTNTGNASIPRVVVQDIFPQFVNFISGPGNFDPNTKTLSFDVISLNVGESRTFSLQGKVVAESQLPQNSGVTCVTNQAVTTTNDGKSSSDNAQLCIERKVLGGVPSKGAVIVPPTAPQVIPATGIEIALLPLFLSVGIAGFLLRKKAFTKELQNQFRY